MRGPQPTPTKILEARGSWRAKGRKDDPPAVPVECPTCPEILRGEARREWTRATAELERMGVLARVDRGMLTLWCELWGEYSDLVHRVPDVQLELAEAEQAETDQQPGAARKLQRLEERLARMGREKRQLARQLVQIGTQFGFSPAARNRVKGDGGDRGQQAPEGKGRFFKAS
jgi:P27 family predicted phage terminase small subunit